MSSSRKQAKHGSMREGTQPVPGDEGDIDRILRLPRGVVYHILELMTARDAARTSILSSKWRYIWAECPTLILDKKIWHDLKQKRSCTEFQDGFVVESVNRMLFHRIGQINKFVIDISVVRSEKHCDVDLWLSFVSRRGVEILTLENSLSTPYTVPSCVFSNSDLTKMSLSNCVLKMAHSPLFLKNLESLKLEKLTLSSWVLETPLLSSLTLKSCRGTRGFIISAPRLVKLRLSDNDDLNLVPYLKCSDTVSAYISVNKKLEHKRDSESITLMKLLSCWPRISQFLVDGSSLKYLTTGSVPKEFSPMLCLTRFVPFFINFNLDEIASVLFVLRNSPTLYKFEIWFKGDFTYDLELVKYLEEQIIMNPKMEQLRIVKIKHFRASKAEILFTKLLLRSAPSLEKMLVEEDENLDPIERLRISKELMRLPRASVNLEIVFGPKLIPVSS